MTDLAEALAMLACIEWRNAAAALAALVQWVWPRPCAPSQETTGQAIQTPDPSDAP